MNKPQDVGSIFPLYEKDLKNAQGVKAPIVDNNKAYYSLCREVFVVIGSLMEDSNRTVLIPAFTCNTVYNPFFELGWNVYFYPVNKDLRIDCERLLDVYRKSKAALVIAHPYFGVDLCANEIEALHEIHEAGAKIIIDLTQCILSTQRLSWVDYYIGSYRKWTAMVDGCFFEPTNPEILKTIDKDLQYNERFAWMQSDAMYLRGCYLYNGDNETKQISRRLNGEAVESIETGITPHRMSDISYSVLKSEDWETLAKKRFDNYRMLYNALKDDIRYSLVCNDLEDVTTAPLYFTVYIEDRRSVQLKLIAQQIYAPVIWPLENNATIVDNTTQYIYNHILSIPCDQRYDCKDMQRILDILLEK